MVVTAVLYLCCLFLHFLGLALGVGTNLAMITLGGATRELAPDERAKFMQRAGALRKNGSFGLLLLILSGLGMLILRGPLEVLRWGGGAFHAKLTLILILIGLFGYMQVVLKKVREAGGGGPLAAKLPKLSFALLALNLSIMACAVIAFK